MKEALTSKEDFYDRKIAPELMRLAKLCAGEGLGFLAAVEYEPGSLAETCALPEGAGVGIRIAQAAVKANGNFDSLAIAVARYAKEHGHTSMVLKQMGIPERTAP